MKQSKILLFLFAATVVGLASCLKEKPMNIDTANGPANVVEFDNTGGNKAKVTSKYPSFYTDLGVLDAGQSKTFNINVSYSGANEAPEDITVNLALDPDVLTKYNTDNGTTLVAPPSDVVSFPTSVVIKKGTRKATALAKVTVTNNFDFNKAYGLPLKIASASTGQISGNFGKVVYSFGVRNKYDGIYSIQSGTVTRYTAPGSPANDALSGSVVGNADLKLATVGANTVEILNIGWHGGGGVGGIDNLRVTVDPATNLVTMSALGNNTLTNWAGKENKYDPATKTFYLAFRWNPTGAVREYEMVIKYKGAR